MNKIKVGDIVGRKSYGKDIIFVVKHIYNTRKGKIAVLRGLIERVEADCTVDDLELINYDIVEESLKELENKVNQRIEKVKKVDEDKNYQIGVLTRNKIAQEKIISGKILHLDGDKKYSEKSYRYYKKLGLNAVVKNIPEYRQPKVVYQLLEIYNPDILVITGHDGMIKRGEDYNNIYNYRNSKHFINTVREARRYDKDRGKNLVIFARCMSKLF